MKKILFVSSDASRTGAPILLLNLVALLKNYPLKYSIKIIIKNGFGELIGEFENVCDVLVWRETPVKQSILSRLLKKTLPFINTKNKKNRLVQEWISEADVVISNTITNGDFLNDFDFNAVKLVLSYVHELEIACSHYTNTNDIAVVKRKTNRYLSPSNSIEHHLINNLNIQKEKIYGLPYYIPFAEIDQTSDLKNNSIFVIGMVGTLDWRKGADLLSVIVALYFKNHPNSTVEFIWKGVNKKSIEYLRLSYELKKVGLTDKVRFEESSDKMNSFYQSIDLLMLISREDPYPLVVLEAASYFKPIICFEGAGGAVDFVKEDAGSIVPFLDLQTLTKTLDDYYCNREKGLEEGITGRKRYEAMHYNEQLILDQFEKALN